MSENIQKTVLHDSHVALGAQMAEFAGFDMPIVYTDIADEHRAVRNHSGVFDVSHMGEVLVTGPEALKFVNRIFSNDVSVMKDHDVVYGMLTNDRGGVVDDLLVYRISADKFLLVINASNIDKDYKWIVDHTPGFDVVTKNLSDEAAEVAVQGPEAEAQLEKLFGVKFDDLGFYTFKVIDYKGNRILVSRTGYTGEDGFEVYMAPDIANEIWSKLLANGVTPCGLGCRDTLRFEVGLPLYGHELSDDISPIEGGLGMFAKFDKEGGFIGSEIIRQQKAEGVTKKIVGLEILDRAIARAGSEVLNEDDVVIGHVTTGYRGISVDKSLAMALVDAKYSKRDTALKVRVRKKVFPAVVCPRKFVQTNYKK